MSYSFSHGIDSLTPYLSRAADAAGTLASLGAAGLIAKDRYSYRNSASRTNWGYSYWLPPLTYASGALSKVARFLKPRWTPRQHVAPTRQAFGYLREAVRGTRVYTSRYGSRQSSVFRPRYKRKFRRQYRRY